MWRPPAISADRGKFRLRRLCEKRIGHDALTRNIVGIPVLQQHEQLLEIPPPRMHTAFQTPISPLSSPPPPLLQLPPQEIRTGTPSIKKSSPPRREPQIPPTSSR